MASRIVHDALITPLAGTGDGTILSFEDHLLRRFGSAQVIRLRPGESFRMRRALGDEVWAVLEGAAAFQLEDMRPSSPSAGVVQSLKAESPVRLLVPFEVRMEVSSITETV